eukprot:gene41576-56260_t
MPSSAAGVCRGMQTRRPFMIGKLNHVGVATPSIDEALNMYRDLLQTQLRLKNSDNAASLALALSQQKGDSELMSLLMSAQFDTGYYRRVQLRSADGKLAFSREAASASGSAPAWFVSAVPIA